MRKFRKLKDMCTVVDIEDRVLFAVDLEGKKYKPSIFSAEKTLYKYETVRKYSDLGWLRWVEVSENEKRNQG